MDARIQHIRQLVDRFVLERGLQQVVTLSRRRLADGSDLLAIAPNRIGAARVDLQTVPLLNGQWEVDVFVENDERPIELIGPMDINAARPDRPTEERLLAILDLVAAGMVFVDEGPDGEALGADVPDPDNYRTSEWMGKTAYEPWL